MPFHSTGPHYCPVCPEHRNKRGNRIDGNVLKLRCDNYSGCGVDFAECPTCGRWFQLSYKVDKVLDITKDIEGRIRKKNRTREVVK